MTKRKSLLPGQRSLHYYFSSSHDPEPSTSADPELSTSADPEPSTSADSEPSTSADPEPSTSADPKPFTSADGLNDILCQMHDTFSQGPDTFLHGPANERMSWEQEVAGNVEIGENDCGDDYDDYESSYVMDTKLVDVNENGPPVKKQKTASTTAITKTTPTQKETICKDANDFSAAIEQSVQEWLKVNEPLTQATAQLHANCQQARLKFHGKTPADGSCFFHAVADQLKMLGLPFQCASDLRIRLVEYLLQNPTLQGPDGTVDLTQTVVKDWDTYCHDMRSCSEWADATAVVGMAHMLTTDILVITSSPASADSSMVWIEGVSNFKGHPLLLGHIHEMHYQSLQTDDHPEPSTSVDGLNDTLSQGPGTLSQGSDTLSPGYDTLSQGPDNER